MDRLDAAIFSAIFAVLSGGVWGLAIAWFWPWLGVVVGMVLFMLVFAVLFIMATQELPEDVDVIEGKPDEL